MVWKVHLLSCRTLSPTSILCVSPDGSLYLDVEFALHIQVNESGVIYLQCGAVDEQKLASRLLPFGFGRHLITYGSILESPERSNMSNLNMFVKVGVMIMNLNVRIFVFLTPRVCPPIYKTQISALALTAQLRL